MRIAVNARLLLKDKLEGLGWYSYEVLRRMVDLEPSAHQFFFFFDRPYDEKFIFTERVEPLVLPPPSRHPLLWYWWFEQTVPRALKRIKADVFFSPDGYCSLKAKTPTLMVTHDLAHLHYPGQIPGLVRRYYDFFVPKYLDRAERVACVSDFVKKDIQEKYGIGAEKLFTVHNAARAGFRELSEKERVSVRSRFSKGKEYFFYLGALHPRKNVERLVQAFDHFKSQTAAPVQLLIGGRMAWQSSAIQKAVADSPYKADILFLGYLEEGDLHEVLGGALALTYVSLFEGFGLPILEAMRAGVPVLTSDVASMPEVAGEAGLLVDPSNVASIAGGMQRLWAEPNLRRAMITKGKERARQFSWENAARELFLHLKASVENTN